MVPEDVLVRGKKYVESKIAPRQSKGELNIEDLSIPPQVHQKKTKQFIFKINATCWSPPLKITNKTQNTQRHITDIIRIFLMESFRGTPIGKSYFWLAKSYLIFFCIEKNV